MMNVFKKDIQTPSYDGTIRPYNPQIVTSNLAPDFIKKNGIYTSTDPRLINNARGIKLNLSKPPIDTTIRSVDMYAPRNVKYGGVQASYQDIGAGQIVYYVDTSIQDAFHMPNFTENAEIIGSDFTDPMGSVKPIYDRNVLNKTKMDDSINNYGTTFLRDTTQFREELMALQIRKINQERWSPKFT